MTKRLWSVLLISGVICIAAFNLNAQDSASALWELTDPNQGGTGLTVATSGQVDANEESFTNMEINQYTGPEGSQRVRIAGNAWPANQTTQLDTVFVQFAVLPKANVRLKVTSLSFFICQASINTMKANVYFSTDPDFATSTPVEYSTGEENNYLTRDSLFQISAAPDMMVDEGETFYLRIYPWVDNDPSVRTGKYICLKDVLIEGQIQPKEVEASVVWPFESDDSPVTSGPLVAQGVSYNETMKFYGTTTLEATDTGEMVTVGAIQTASQSWYAEPEPTDTLYFDFQVAPKFGGTFFVDSVSLYIGAWFTNNIKAAIYYSKDASFTEKTLLFPDMSLVGNKVAPFSASLSDTVETGKSFYLRVYPHNTQAEGWAKLVAVRNVTIWGRTFGVSSDPPTVTTAALSNLSTTFVNSGGNIPSDGGAVVTARGVVWNTSGSPTTADGKTQDGTGSGSFVSVATGLAPGTTYFLRAYATNEAGASYGEEFSFTTLDSIEVPTVATASITDILVTSATGGGNVSFWGGDTVIARGVVWNATGNPTLADSKTEDGAGAGPFVSTLFPLAESTNYYVRAYATNSKGTGYGEEVTFTTQAPAPDVEKVVALDGSGDYTSVQAAFDAVPDFYTGKYIIRLKPGTYYEKLLLDRNKTNVILVGESAENTILTYDDYAGKAGGTSMSYSVAIDADDFAAINITFQNTVVNDGSFNDQQGVALRINGDRQSYYNCKLLGFQDTFYVWGGRGTGRVYMKECYVEGSVDFIFGRDIVLFDDCEIHINRNGGTLTAASTEADTRFGLVFMNCKITADEVGFDGSAITSFVLGRPWQQAPRTVFINCEEPATLSPAGWLSWNVTPALYAEYNCYGPGSDTSNRASFSTQLTEQDAAEYTVENIFAKSSNPGLGFDWMPEKPIVTSVKSPSSSGQIPAEFGLMQNYPNPFNPVTTIRFLLPESGKVKLSVYNTLGQLVATLVDKELEAGDYRIAFDAAKYPSGVYFYRIESGNFIKARKMLLLK